MSPKTRITNDKFSTRVCHIANSYGFKTIGSFYKFVKQCQPSTKLYLGLGHCRASQIVKELQGLFDEPKPELRSAGEFAMVGW